MSMTIILSMLLSAPTFCEFRYLFAFHLGLPVILTLPFLPIRSNAMLTGGVPAQN
jgi:hypothetical protein